MTAVQAERPGPVADRVTGPHRVLRSALWPLACLVAALGGFVAGDVPDQGLFAGLGEALLHGHLSAVYATPVNQAGPLQLLLTLGLVRAADLLGSQHLTQAVMSAAVVLAARAAVRRAGSVHPAREATVATLAALWMLPGGMWDGHPAEALIPAAWIAACVLVRRSRWVAAGVLLTGATAIAPWAVLAAPALLVGRPRDAVRAWAVTAAGSAAVYLPFVLTGHFALPHHRWPVHTYSLVHLLQPHAASFSWADRLGQALIVASGCALVALHAGRAGVVLAPVSAAALRVVTDPVTFAYYWVPVGLAAMLLPLVLGERIRRPQPAVLLLAYLPVLGGALTGPYGFAGLALGAVTSVAVTVVAVRRRPTGRP